MASLRKSDVESKASALSLDVFRSLREEAVVRLAPSSLKEGLGCPSKGSSSESNSLSDSRGGGGRTTFLFFLLFTRKIRFL